MEEKRVLPKKKKRKNDKQIRVTIWTFSVLFSLLIGYYGWFMIFKRDDFVLSGYNSARQDIHSERVVRGAILSSEGHVLAETVTDEEGNETRHYPYGSAFAHVVGYSSKGKTGLEIAANAYLTSSHMAVTERIENELEEIKNPGDNVITTLRTELQQAAWNALGDKEGAVVVIEPSTGKVLAEVSKPDFDPNEIDEIWYDLTAEDSEKSNLFNRAVLGLYPPGSTFKIVELLEYIRENPDSYEQDSFDCEGSFQYNGYTIRCAGGSVHGTRDLKGAFASSCNCSFAQIGLGLNWASLGSLCDALYFNGKLPTDIAHSRSSFQAGDDPSDWEKLQASIGQGETLMTPLHSAMLAAAIANDGVLMEPYLIDQIGDAEDHLVKRMKPVIHGSLMTRNEAQILQEYMRAVVTDGTASSLYTDAYDAYGKTGSAQFEDSGKESHAWFTGFAALGDKRIALAVVIEGGGSGGEAAVPVAREVFDAWASELTNGY